MVIAKIDQFSSKKWRSNKKIERKWKFKFCRKCLKKKIFQTLFFVKNANFVRLCDKSTPRKKYIIVTFRTEM